MTSSQTIPLGERQRAVRLVAQVAHVDESVILNSRRPEIVSWRRATMVAFRRAGYSFPQIGAAFRRDHTTVMDACRRANKDLVRIVIGMVAIIPVHAALDLDVAAIRAEVAVAREVQANIDAGERAFDVAVARLDRALSEIMIQANLAHDDADIATLRHHAGDLVLSGVAILKRLGRLEDLAEYLPKEGT